MNVDCHNSHPITGYLTDGVGTYPTRPKVILKLRFPHSGSLSNMVPMGVPSREDKRLDKSMPGLRLRLA